jgi:hypothetical protein
MGRRILSTVRGVKEILDSSSAWRATDLCPTRSACPKHIQVLSSSSQFGYLSPFLFPKRPEVRSTKGRLSKHLYRDSGIKETVFEESARLAPFPGSRRHQVSGHFSDRSFTS